MRAAELGLKVTLLEKMSTSAGNTIYAAGFLLGVHTSFQAGKNDADSVDAFYEDMMKVSQGKGDPKLTRKVAEDADKTLEWLHKSAGINFAAGSKLVWPMLSRAHLVTGKVKPGGAQLSLSLIERAKALGVDLRFNTKAVAILQDEKTGAVNGVRIKTKEGLSELRSKKGVVIAAGGWARSEDLLRRFTPAAEKALKLGGLGNTGDGTKMAWALGADLLDVSYTKATYGFNPKTKTSAFVMYNGAVIVNKKGERFADESRPYKELGELVMQEPDGIGYQVYDAAIHAEAQKDPLAKTDYLKKNGELFEADTLEALAGKIGVPADALVRTVKAYNEGLARGADAFGRTSLSAGGGKPQPITKSPFYAFAATACLLSTYCGPKIDTEARVVNIFGEVIPGLWAAGEGTGGFHGAAYMSGTSVGKAVIFGKIAAESIAKA